MSAATYQLTGSQSRAILDVPEDDGGDEQFLARLGDTVDKYVRISDQGEDARRKSDRIGANLFAGRHWDVRQSPDRAALTIPYSKRLINQLISLQTKNDPIWVVAPSDAGDRESSRAMMQLMPDKF